MIPNATISRNLRTTLGLSLCFPGDDDDDAAKDDDDDADDDEVMPMTSSMSSL